MTVSGLRPWLALVAILVLPAAAGAERLRIAVAANFRPVLQALVDEHAAATGDQVVVSVGSTGMLHAQISRGAPFDLFLAADAARPARLERDGRIVPGTRATYAIGRLALWIPGVPVTGPEAVRAVTGRIAMADPAVAPFGVAAEESIRALGLEPALADRLVRGHSIGQAYQFVASGAAVAGFVARSQLSDADPAQWWLLPPRLHTPIEQQLVLLRESEAGRRFIAYLASEAARQRIAAAGYGLPPS